MLNSNAVVFHVPTFWSFAYGSTRSRQRRSSVGTRLARSSNLPRT